MGKHKHEMTWPEALMRQFKPRKQTRGLRGKVAGCVYCEGLTPTDISTQLLLYGGYNVCRDHFTRIEETR